MKRGLFAALILLGAGFVTAAAVFGAEKLPAMLEDVGIHEQLGAQVDLGLAFRDETGRPVSLREALDGRHPVALFLAYYGCPNLCNLFLNGATDVLKKLEWTPGKEFRVLTVSIDPKETPEQAARKKATYLRSYGRPEAARGWSFWVNDRAAPSTADDVNSRRLADQVGFRYKYDAEQAQFAHSAAMIVLTPEGKVSRYLYGIDFRAKDLRLALVEASGKKIGTVMDRIMLFCYNYDPKTKKYSLYATNLMRAGGGLTAFMVAGSLLAFWRRNRKRGEL